MLKKMTYKVFAFFMIVAMLNATAGCNLGNFSSQQESENNNTIGEPNLMVRQLPDFIVRILDNFEPRGYEYSPEYVTTVEFTSWSEGMSDSVHGTITYYPMEYVGDAEASVAYIEYIQTDVVDWVQPFIVSFVEPPQGEGYELIAEGLWSRSFMPTRTDGGKYELMDMAASPHTFGACWLAGSVGGCVTSGIACTVSGPGWVPCAAVGCGASIIGSEIGCAILSWLS